MKLFITARSFFAAVCAAVSLAPLSAQGFGFGGDSTAGAAQNSVAIHGEAAAGITVFINDLNKGTRRVHLGDVFSGKLSFAADTQNAGANITLRLAPAASPVTLDEAFLHASFGSFDVEGGLRKLTWGRADSAGPLDVINPLDYSDLTLLVDNLHDTTRLKIARPLFHAAWNAGAFSKFEAVFIPWFEGTRFDVNGRWAPKDIKLLENYSGFTKQMPDTMALYYAQTGARFTTTIGPADIGIQYFNGRLPLPAFRFELANTQYGLIPTSVIVDYNRYNQIGVDGAMVLAGFNLRAECAVNLTEDFKGDDGAVYNPHLVWSLGFDCSVFSLFDVNMQCNEKIIFAYDKIDDNNLKDIEAAAKPTATRVTAKISKTFFRDELEIAAAGIWNIEDSDALLLPAVTLTKGDFSFEVAGGIFTGNKKGQFGYYHDNNFVRAQIKYVF